MFNEREALRTRLEQLHNAELKVMREYREERDRIYGMLRELDNQREDVSPSTEETTLTALQNKKLEDFVPQNEFPLGGKRRKAYTGSKSYQHRQAAYNILKEHTEMRGVDLQKEVEKETGTPVNNMTTLMNQLMKYHPEVQKPYRGRYLFRHNFKTRSSNYT
ncbi:transcriptional repressor Rok [Bacillus licheniformis]|uniref:Rok-like winged helix domain-containing protein n=1 Tax=Bacillus TaxID=1386 RepID=UPI00227FFD2E|nr:MULTISPECIES: transcriptional repressor Rok [Bacillus]MCY7861200.1 transcriptional repressor Rok [Bacillus haynesii]MCY8015472.1 transcriptional repressor Rok [Bacillus haynesii]MCY8291471.1 transcriptional repressor Rok [Bacillus haynesii]MCY8549094.1 transcriptional repressor Rok [Bacillus haynesii]MCY8745157.1 transcriptional repressor Rok [Bacillus licheniformis]